MPAAAALPTQPASMRFGRFELQPRERRLLVDGQPVALGARAFDLLVTLAARPDRLVTKSELLDLVWPGLVVEESNLHTQMSTLRKVLGGEIIATVPGRGYRFTAQAQVVADAALAQTRGTLPATPATGGEPAADPSPTSAAGASSPAPIAAVPAAAPSASARAVLPAVGGRLIGRDADRARLDDALQAPGCVTLVGAGGVGKTRLALAVAQGWRGRRVWVDLAPLTEDVQVAGALARALDLTVADTDAAPQLARALAGGAVLLVLDNAEHLVDASAALVANLIAAAPALHVLVTSQLPLALAGERVVHLEPLSIEDELASPAGREGAMALLAERIAAAGHRGRLDPAAAPVLRQICRDLDGLPLALEMAAARVPLLGLTGVRDELAQRFALLTKGHRQSAPRHRTLHAALDWSFALLGAQEQRLFAALGVFPGSFPLALCVALLSAPGTEATASRWDLIDRLATLVDRSLVAVSAEDPPRYRLLETMRAYALEKLEEAGEAATLRRRHAEVLIDYLPASSNDVAGMLRGVPEMDHVREALAWTRDHALDLAVRLTTRAAIVTTFTPWRAQCFKWLQELEPLVEAPENAAVLPLDLRAAWWAEYARTAVSSMYVHAPELARRARAVTRQHADPVPLFTATAALARGLHEATPELDEACAEIRMLMDAHPEWPPRMRLVGTGALSNAANRRGDHEALLGLRYQEMAYAREAGNPRAVDAVETNIGFTLQALKRYEEALYHYRAVAARLEGQKDANLAWALSGVFDALLALGRLDEARAMMGHAAAVGAMLDLPLHTSALTQLAFARGRHEAAALLAGHARHAFDVRGMWIGTFSSESIEPVEKALATLLGEAKLRELEQAGRSLTDAQALELACGD